MTCAYCNGCGARERPGDGCVVACECGGWPGELRRQAAARGFVERVLPVDPEADALVEAYAAERERANPLPRRPITKRGGS